MPEKKTRDRARKDKQEGKSASTQAGEFVREEMEHIREGKHGAASPQQAIAIGLSKARRAGVDLKPPAKGKYDEATRKKAKQDLKKGQEEPNAKPSPKRSKAVTKALKKKSTKAASKQALSQQAHKAAAKRATAKKLAPAKKAAAKKRTAAR